MSNRYIIDRVEGNYAILEKEDGNLINIPIENIKGDFKDGDVLIKIDDEYFEIDKEFTLSRKCNVDNITKNMWE